MPAAVHIRPAVPADAAAVAALYNHYVLHSRATLQSVPAQAADFAQAIRKALFLVATDAANTVLGYCSADVMKSRCGYAHTYELSIYVAAHATGGGIGKALMAAFVHAAQDTPAYKLVAVIGLPNPASIALHEQFGFVHCGTLPAAGWKFNQWHDVGYWLLQLKDGNPPPP